MDNEKADNTQSSHEAPVSSFERALELLSKSAAEIIGDYKPAGNGFLDAMCSAIEAMGKILPRAEEIASNIVSALNASQQIIASFVSAVENISIPTLSEERKQEMLESHLRWGRLGWTWFQNAPMSFYDNPPTDMKDANARVKHLCTMQGMESIFNRLRAQKVNHEDLESAIFCFRNGQYKACALMLFGLIDAKLIRVQPRNKKREVGSKAVHLLKTQFEGNKDEQVLYIMLFCSNLFACLETIFAYGNNFKDEPDIVNRNFADHGMNRRRIRKRDCVQLFLVLNNLMYFLSEDIVLLAG